MIATPSAASSAVRVLTFIASGPRSPLTGFPSACQMYAAVAARYAFAFVKLLRTAVARR